MDNNDDNIEYVTMNRYGFYTALCFTINFIVGVGTLELPYAYQQAGIIQGLVASILMGFCFCIGVNWVCVASARALGICTAYKCLQVKPTSITSPVSYGTMSEDRSRASTEEEEDELITNVVRADVEKGFVRTSRSLTRELSSFISSRRQQSHDDADDESGDSKTLAKYFDSFDMDSESNSATVRTLNDDSLFTFNELLDVFCPLPVKMLYELLFCSLIFFALWSYSSVFGKSMTAKLPIFDWGNACNPVYTDGCTQSYEVYVLVYGLAVVYLTLTEFSEMVLFQIFLTCARFLLLAVVILTSVFGIFFDKSDHSMPDKTAPPSSNIGDDVALWNWHGSSVIVAGLLFGQLISFGTPTLISPLRKRSQSSKLMIWGIIVTGALYALVSSSAVLYWGSALQSQINLTYSKYDGGASAGEGTPWWAYFVQYYVDLFPALDVLSMFPLVSITLGNSLLAFIIRVWPQARRLHFARSPVSPTSPEYAKLSLWQRTSWVKLASRLLASVPPVVGALFERDISKIIQYASVPAVFIAFVFPAFLQWYSSTACKTLGLPSRTLHCIGSNRTNIGLVGLLLVVSAFLLVLEVGQLVNKKFLT